MSIGEYARVVELSVSAVRFYADRGLLAPAATDPTTGYRYYTDDQVERGSMIRDLRRIDMSLSDIANVLELPPTERNAAVDGHIRQLEVRLAEVHAAAHTFGVALGRRPSATTTLSAVDLARAIVQTLPAAGSDPRHPHHMGMLVELLDNSLRCAATDSHRLAVRDLVPRSFGSAFSTVVAAADIRSWPDALAAVGEVTIDLADGVLIAQGAGLDLRSPSIPVDFPDYESVLRTSTGLSTTIVVDREQLMSLIRGFDGDSTIVLSTSGPGLSAARDGAVRHIAADVSGVDALVAINPRYAADAIEQAVGPELIIEIDDALHPLTFRSADDGTYTSMLMPVNLA